MDEDVGLPGIPRCNMMAQTICSHCHRRSKALPFVPQCNSTKLSVRFASVPVAIQNHSEPNARPVMRLALVRALATDISRWEC